MPPAHSNDAVSRGAADPHQSSNAVARDIVASDRNRPRIDVACQHSTAQQLGRGDRQYSGSGADIERMGDPTPAR